jgi:hypothetical protein
MIAGAYVCECLTQTVFAVSFVLSGKAFEIKRRVVIPLSAGSRETLPAEQVKVCQTP